LFIKTKHGAPLSVDYQNFDIYATILTHGGQWEGQVMDCCEAILRPGDVFFDIGASAGIFTLDLSALIPDLTVFAFEPQPTLARHCRQSIARGGFDRVKLFEVLLGAEEGEASLFLTRHSVHASTVAREARYREIRVPRRALDDLLAAGEVAGPDIIKIDVEGGELSVFKGAEKLLRTYQPSIVLEADVNMNRMGYTADDLFQLLTDIAPYKFFLIEGDGSIVPATRPYPFGNFLALSPRHAERLSLTS